MAVLEPEFDEELQKRTIRRITARLIPFMCLMYLLNIIDRVNVGVASLAITRDLNYTQAQFGLGAGIFFIGYFIFEVPSNIILEKVGARRWMARIMVTWGIIASSLMFITPNPNLYYFLRFMLGVAEAGFFPGMIVYLTYWFPAKDRARAGAKFIVAGCVAGIIGPPLGASLLKLEGYLGLHGWQWLFLMEGLPSFIVGFFALKVLTDRPAVATWLPNDEKAWLISKIESEQTSRLKHVSLFAALKEKKVLHLCTLFFLWQVANNGVGFFMPKLLKARSTWDDTSVIWITAIPAIAGAITLLIAATYSDKLRERRKFIIYGFAAYVASMALIIYAPTGPTTVAALTLKEGASRCADAPFWAVATGFLQGTAAAGGVAMINSVGNLGGFVGPYMMGYLKDKTGSFNAGLIVLMIVMVGATYSAIRIKHDKVVEYGE